MQEPVSLLTIFFNASSEVAIRYEVRKKVLKKDCGKSDKLP